MNFYLLCQPLWCCPGKLVHGTEFATFASSTPGIRSLILHSCPFHCWQYHCLDFTTTWQWHHPTFSTYHGHGLPQSIQCPLLTNKLPHLLGIQQLPFCWQKLAQVGTQLCCHPSTIVAIQIPPAHLPHSIAHSTTLSKKEKWETCHQCFRATYNGFHPNQFHDIHQIRHQIRLFIQNSHVWLHCQLLDPADVILNLWPYHLFNNTKACLLQLKHHADIMRISMCILNTTFFQM